MVATITPTFVTIPGQEGIDGYQVTWGPMANGDVGLGVGNPLGFGAGATTVAGGGPNLAGYADKSIQVEGTFGAAGSVACEGTNDGNAAHFRALTDPSQVTIAITAAGIKSVTEAVIWVRPHVTAGDGTTSLTATMFFRKTQPR